MNEKFSLNPTPNLVRANEEDEVALWNFLLKYLDSRLNPLFSLSPFSLLQPLPALTRVTTTTLKTMPKMSKTTATTASITTTTQDAGKENKNTIPELKTYPLTPTDTKTLIPALRLIADSVAQQRQTAARALIFHPLFLSIMAAVIAVVYKVLYKSQADLPLIGTTSAGCVMGGLLVVRGLTGGYIEEAERVGRWEWLRGPDGEEQEQVVLVTQFGERIIGTVVLRGVPVDGKTTGVIRAWTVERRYRGKGVGVGLLEEAVELCREKGWEGPVFEEEHANAKRVLPGLFNGGFERREKWARKTLEGVKKRME